MARLRAVTTAVGAALVAPLLVGCSSGAIPADPTAAERLQVYLQLRSEVWELQFPGEPVPAIEPESWMPDFAAQQRVVVHCITQSGIPGLMVDLDTGGFQFSSAEGASYEDVLRRRFECESRYPIEPGSPDLAWVHTEAQRGYLWDYYRERLIPCLESIDYRVLGSPTREAFVTSLQVGLGWSPYVALEPMPETEQEWARIDVTCPRPPWSQSMAFPADGAAG